MPATLAPMTVPSSPEMCIAALIGLVLPWELLDGFSTAQKCVESFPLREAWATNRKLTGPCLLWHFETLHGYLHVYYFALCLMRVTPFDFVRRHD